MNRKGFALLQIIIVLGIAAILVGGGFFFNSTQNQKNIVQIGNDAREKAKELQQHQSQVHQEGDTINQLTDSTASPTNSTTLIQRTQAELAPSSSAELPV